MGVNKLAEKTVFDEGVSAGREPALLVGPEAAGQMLGCSPRHIRRICDAGQMPPPVKLGSKLIRWSRAEIENWIADGCRPVR